MTASDQHIMKGIPKVDRVLEWPEIAAMLASCPRPEVLKAVRTVLDQVRKRVRDGRPHIDRDEIVSLIVGERARRDTHSLRPLVNGTGVVVHTNLGRSPLADGAESAILAVAARYSNLEYDLSSGERGSRNSHMEGLICELTGAEAALVVNNNAAAVILALSALAAGREVIISRGELVEIGGSFRIPDVMCQSGATLVEVGTTNRTHLRDFRSALTDATALLLKVHPSNFAITGFTSDVPVGTLAALGREAGLPVMLDAGSGCLVDLAPYGISGEPTIRQYLDEGADVVTFSGDKLLGGPQAGIIAGKRDLLEPMKRHPLLRAFRMDKLSLAALEATLRIYRDDRCAMRDIPTLRMLTMSTAELSRRAAAMVRKFRRALPETVTLTMHRGESSAGGGSFPLLQLPTTLIEVQVSGVTPTQLETALRRTATPVIGRIHRERFLLDVRTILDRDINVLLDALKEAAAALGAKRQ